MRVAIISDSTLSHFTKALQEKTLSDGTYLELYEPAFDTGQLEIFDDDSSTWKFDPDIFFYHISSFNFADKLTELVEISEQENFAKTYFYDHALLLKKIISKGKKVIVTNLGYMVDRAHGSMGPLVCSELNSQIDLFNSLLYDEINKESLMNLLDLKYISFCIGIKSFHDIRLWAYGRFPFSHKYTLDVVSEFLNIIELHIGAVKKVIILDLDNTLWGGVIGDDGIEGIEVGSEKLGYLYRNFQKFIRRFKNRGMLLAISSKNDIVNVNSAFSEVKENFLKLDDFTIIEANWENKAANIIKISKTLELSLDSFVFLDDNPVERALVKKLLPEICVPHLGDDPSNYVDIVSSLPVLQTISVTSEDSSRTVLYKAKAKRNLLEEKSINLEDFLISLEMSCIVEELNELNVERAYQLIQRSNQFNLTTSRFNVKDLLEKDQSLRNDYFCRVYRLNDKFGDSGIISVVVLRKEQSTLMIEEFVMSCRVLKRTVEQFIINDLVGLSLNLSIDALIGKYRETTKNSLVSELYLENKFINHKCDGKIKMYKLNLVENLRLKTFVVGEYNDTK
jgi:FkbH-like protein